jgi:hypothetical protein
VLAGSTLGCLVLAALAGAPAAAEGGQFRSDGAAVRADGDRASRSFDRAGALSSSDSGITDSAIKALDKESATPTAAPTTPQTPAAPTTPAPAPAVPALPIPVAGLSQTQMNNAQAIVNAGKALGLPKRAYVLAVACAMQESNLRNLASVVLPESFNFTTEGSGSDHDSVGLFQQRPSSGWGAVKDLMNPDFAAKQFYRALVQVPGWQGMALTYAIQTVQVSAFPEAYAKHEWRAQAVVDALAG